MSHIQFVKKILASGEACPKCIQVAERLERDGLTDVVNQTIIADERDAQSPGMQLARQHQVERAPFFLVEDDAGNIQVFDAYFSFKKYVQETQR